MVLTGTALLLQCIYAGQLGAYNPKEDPAIVQRSAERSSASSAQLLGMVGEFERLQPGNSSRVRELPAARAPQPTSYTASGSPDAASQARPYAAAPVDPYLWYGYAAPGWAHPFAHDPFFRGGRHAPWGPHAHALTSPRIPWWSLLRFTKH
jgi:hypothetical protein